MTSPHPVVERLARRVLTVERGLKNLNRSARLASSSIEDGAIREFTLDDQLVSIIGKQFDGTHGAVVVAGPTPPVPEAATVLAVAGGLRVRHEGGWITPPPADQTLEPTPTVAPLDFARYEIYATETPVWPGPLFDNLRATIESVRGGEILIALDPSPGTGYYVWVAARTLAGRLGEPSAAFGPVQPINVLQLTANAQEIADAAKAAADQAVLDAQAAADAAEAAEQTAGAVSGQVATAQQAADDAAESARVALAAATAASELGTNAQQAADLAQAAADAAAEAAADAGTDAAAADAKAAQAAADAAQAIADAQAAADAVSGVDGKADAALLAANGKNRIFAQATKPSGTSYIAGDMWIDTANGRRLYFWDPSAAGGAGDFISQLIGNAAIAPGSLVGSDVLVEGSVLAAQIHADAINGKTITGATIRTAGSGPRLELTTAAGLRGFAADGTTVNTQLTTDGKLTAKSAVIQGEIATADSGPRVRMAQRVGAGGAQIGEVQMYGGATAELAATLAASTSAGDKQVTLSFGNSGSGTISGPTIGLQTTSVWAANKRYVYIDSDFIELNGQVKMTTPPVQTFIVRPGTFGGSFDHYGSPFQKLRYWITPAGEVRVVGLITNVVALAANTSYPMFPVPTVARGSHVLSAVANGTNTVRLDIPDGAGIVSWGFVNPALAAGAYIKIDLTLPLGDGFPSGW